MVPIAYLFTSLGGQREYQINKRKICNIAQCAICNMPEISPHRKTSTASLVFWHEVADKIYYFVLCAIIPKTLGENIQDCTVCNMPEFSPRRKPSTAASVFRHDVAHNRVCRWRRSKWGRLKSRHKRHRKNNGDATICQARHERRWYSNRSNSRSTEMNTKTR